MIKRKRLLAASLVATLVLAACGGDDDTTESTEATAEATAEETAEATAEETAEATAEETAEATAEETAEATAEETAEATAEATAEETAEVVTAAEQYAAICEANAGVEVPADFKVALVTDIGKIDDRTFNQFAYEGMEAASDCFGFETTFIETVSDADYAQNIATALEFEPSVVVTVGFLMADTTLEAANANPDVDWIGIDQFHDEFPENYIGVLFREDEGGFLAGAMAGLLSETGVVGVVGGREDVPPVVRFVNAYEQGAKYVNPDAQVLSIYNESFTDPAKGASDANQFIGEGADVIFGAGGKTGSGGIQAAAEQGKWAIGVDQDEYFTTFNSGAAPGAEWLATSAVKRVDLGVLNNIIGSLDGSWAGGIYTLSAENEGITFAPPHDAPVPADVLAQVEEIRVGLAAGNIETGVDPVTGLPL